MPVTEQVPHGARQPGIAAARSGAVRRRVHQPMRLYVGGELFHGTSAIKVIEPDRLDWPEELRAEFALGVPWTTAPLADHDRLGAKAVARRHGRPMVKRPENTLGHVVPEAEQITGL